MGNASRHLESGEPSLTPEKTEASRRRPDSRFWADQRHASQGGGSSRIYLARHGRTPLNAAGVLRGRLDPELDLTGLGEANALADLLGRAGIQLVVSSPLKRAHDTAAQVAARAGVDVEIDERLIDRDYGSWAGKPTTDLIARWGSVDAAPGVEPQADVFARSMDALLAVTRRVVNGTAVVVSHDAVIQLLLPVIDPRLEGFESVPQDTGHFNVIENEGGVWSVTSIDNNPADNQGRRVVAMEWQATRMKGGRYDV